MSTATLNIWVTRRGDPCRIEDTFEHRVYVTHCNGDILEYCRKKYVNLFTKCGHLELEVPPGCYIVGAVGGWAPDEPTSQYLGNFLTHVAIVQAKCGDHVCVTLFDPSLHYCGTWIGAAINTHLIGGGNVVPRELVAPLKNAGAAVDALVKVLPPDRFAVTTAKAIGTRPPGATKGKAKKGG